MHGLSSGRQVLWLLLVLMVAAGGARWLGGRRTSAFWVGDQSPASKQSGQLNTKSRAKNSEAGFVESSPVPNRGSASTPQELSPKFTAAQVQSISAFVGKRKGCYLGSSYSPQYRTSVLPTPGDGGRGSGEPATAITPLSSAQWQKHRELVARHSGLFVQGIPVPPAELNEREIQVAVDAAGKTWTLTLPGLSTPPPAELLLEDRIHRIEDLLVQLLN